MEERDQVMAEEDIKNKVVVEDAGIEYTQEEDLKPLDTDDLCAFAASTVSRLTSEEWKEVFYGFDDLRRIYKFHSAEFKQFLPKFSKHIYDGVENLRSSICRNALNLVTEVFSTDKNLNEVDETGELTSYSEFSVEIIPVVCKKIADDKVFISSRGKAALESISKHWFSKGITLTLCELSKSKSLAISTEVSNALKDNSLTLPAEFWLQSENMELLFNTLSEDIASKRQPFGKNAKLVLKSICDKIGEEAFKEIAKISLGSAEAAEKLFQSFQVKKEKDNSKGFRDFLKKKKNVKQNKDDEDNVFIS